MNERKQVSFIFSKKSCNGSFHKVEQVSSTSFPVFRENYTLRLILKIATGSDFEKFQDFVRNKPI